jgi:hypothetical protein
VALAGESAVVSLLGGADPSGASYNAAGLLNSIVQAGTPEAGSAPATLPVSLDQGIVDSLTQADSGSASLASLAATVPTGTIEQTASYAAILQASPGLAATVIGDATAQGIIASISTSA